MRIRVLVRVLASVGASCVVLLSLDIMVNVLKWRIRFRDTSAKNPASGGHQACGGPKDRTTRDGSRVLTEYLCKVARTAAPNDSRVAALE